MWIIKEDRRTEHKCRKPFNWFCRSFGVGSVWACDGCSKVYIYRTESSWGELYTYWFYLRERTAEDNKRFLDKRVIEVTN